MEDRIRTLEITQAVQAEKLVALTNAVEENTKAVLALTEKVAQAKGGWAVLSGMAALVSFIVTMIVTWFSGKGHG